MCLSRAIVECASGERLVEPVGSESVQVVAEHLAVVGEHVILGDPPAELPVDPVHELLRHRDVCVASRRGDVGEIAFLVRLVELPDVCLERTADGLPVDRDAGVAIEAVPLALRQEVEEKLRDGRAADVEEVSAADVERAPVDHAGPAEPAGVLLPFEDEEVADAAAKQRVRQREAGRTGANDRDFRFHCMTTTASLASRATRRQSPLVGAARPC